MNSSLSYNAMHVPSVEPKLLSTGEERLRGPQPTPTVPVHVLAYYRRKDPGRQVSQLLKELDMPLILLVGGATGTGKSTVTSEVAYRLGITRAMSTDTIRQTMRELCSRKTMPSIYYSSFATESAAAPSDGRPAEPNLVGFLDQARDVLIGVRAALLRALEEGYSTAFEGVHILPGSIPASLHRRIVVQCLLTIRDEETHTSRFCTRGSSSCAVRPAQKYLRHLPGIRHIQNYMVEQAKKAGVPVIENSHMEETVNAVLHLIMNKVEQARARTTESDGICHFAAA